MNPVLKHSHDIKRDADEILRDSDLIKCLGKYGQVSVGGSYKYDLMWNPDIDIMVVCDDPRRQSLAAIKELMDLRQFQKYQYGDFEKFKRPNRLEAFIVVLILPFNGKKWEIETWFVDKYPQYQSDMDKLIESKLDDTSKLQILEAKKSREEAGIDKFGISSVDIYKQVLY